MLLRTAGFGRFLFRSVFSFRTLSTSAMDDQQNRYMDEEHVILVSEQDEYRGKASKREAHTWSNIEKNGMLHRAFSVFLFNDNNELLLQKRAGSKVTFPCVWTNTCCSHPLHVLEEMDLENDAIGVRRAAQRKMVHELGIRLEEVPVDKFTYITRLLYKHRDPKNVEWGEHELDYILFIRGNVVPFPNLNEVEATQYVSKLGLKLLLKKSQTDPKLMQFSPWFLLLAEHYLFDWWEYLNDLDKIIDRTKILNHV